jgi:tetratricopeptide (TPR) repeat protein
MYKAVPAFVLSMAILSSSAIANDSAVLAYRSGLAEKESGRAKAAFDLFQKAVQLDSTYTEAHRELGTTAMAIRRFDVAERSFAKVLEYVPEDTFSIVQMANLHFTYRRWKPAVEYGKKALALHAGSRMNYIVGKSHLELEQYEPSFRYLDAAYKDEPGNAEVPYLIARGLFDISNFKLSSKYYSEAIALDSSKVGWIYEAAIAYSSIPDYRTAIGYYELAMARGYRVDEDFIENLSENYVGAGMPEKAIEWQKSLLEKSPMDQSLMFMLADTYYKSGEYKKAISQWEQLLMHDNENARAVYMIGMALQKSGDKKKGQAMCNKAIEMDPSLRYYRQVFRW